MKYCLVLWVDHGDLTSIIEDRFISDRSMLKDPGLVGMVTHGHSKQKEPAEGWEVAKGRVLFVADTEKAALEKEFQLRQERDGSLKRQERATRAKKKLESEFMDPSHVSFRQGKPSTCSSSVDKHDNEKKKNAGSQLQMKAIMSKMKDKYSKDMNTCATSDKFRPNRKRAYSPETETSSSDEEQSLIKIGAERLALKVMDCTRTNRKLKDELNNLKRFNLYLQEGLPQIIKAKSVCAKCTFRPGPSVSEAVSSLPLPEMKEKDDTAGKHSNNGADNSDDELTETGARSATRSTDDHDDEAKPAITYDLEENSPMKVMENNGADTSDIEVTLTETEAGPEPSTNEAEARPATGAGPEHSTTEAEARPATRSNDDETRPATADVDDLEDAFSLLNTPTKIAVRKQKKFGIVAGLLVRALFTRSEINKNTTMTGTRGEYDRPLDEKRINLISRHIMKHCPVGDEGNQITPSKIRRKITKAISYMKNGSVHAHSATRK